jgi:predicted DNA-binding protein (UPF0251 family)
MLTPSEMFSWHYNSKKEFKHDEDIEGRVYKGFEYIFIMVRPKKCKMVYAEPETTYFKPRAIPLMDLKEVELTVEEFEAIRLIDMEKMKQIAVAKKMKISQPTLHRLLQSAHRKIADALVNGKAIKIHGGNYSIEKR